MGGSRERSQGSPAASMGRLSLVSIFAAPLRNLEEMRLCMLKRAASLRGNSRDVSTGGNTSPSLQSAGEVGEVSGAGRGNKGRERAAGTAPELLLWLRTLELSSWQHPQT